MTDDVERQLLGPELHRPVTHAVLVDAVTLYFRNFRLFASLVFLPTFAGIFLLALSRSAIAQITSHIPSDIESRLRAIRNSHITLEVGLINAAGFLGLWLCWAFAFAAVTVAVTAIRQGRPPEAEDCFNQAREKPSRFLLSSGYLFLKILILSYVVANVAFFWLFQIAERVEVRLNPYIVGLVEVSIIAAVTLPFLLAIPVSTVEDLGLVPSLKRSFTLTEGNSMVMLGLFIEAELSAFFLSWFLRWTVYVGFTGVGIPALHSGVYYIELIAAALLQPIAMIGFAWIYATTVISEQRPKDGGHAVLERADAI